MPPRWSIPADGAIPDYREAAVVPRSDRHSAALCNLTPVAMQLAAERDRVATAMSDTVVRRLFTAGLALEHALALLDHHPAAGKVRAAIAELDLAIRDVRQVIFDSYGTAAASDSGPG